MHAPKEKHNKLDNKALPGMNMNLKKKRLEKMEFELKNEGFDSSEEESSESDNKVEL